MPKYNRNKIIKISIKVNEGIQPARESKHAAVTRHPSRFNRASFRNPGMNPDILKMDENDEYEKLKLKICFKFVSKALLQTMALGCTVQVY